MDDGWLVATEDGGALAIATGDCVSIGESALGDVFVGDALTGIDAVGVSRSVLQLDVCSRFGNDFMA